VTAERGYFLQAAMINFCMASVCEA